jgi:hypothetical protein
MVDRSHLPKNGGTGRPAICIPRAPAGHFCLRFASRALKKPRGAAKRVTKLLNLRTSKASSVFDVGDWEFEPP